MVIQTDAFSIGVVGHRWNRMDQNHEPQLSAIVAALFATIDQTLPDMTIRLVTGLAEGADQIAAMTMPERWQLIAVLPMSVDHYERHLATHGTGDPAQAITRLKALLARPNTILTETKTVTPEEGYIAVQQAILADADLMLAVWDGAAGAGLGGTNDTISKALAIGALVIWIDADPSRGQPLRQVLTMSHDGIATAREVDDGYLQNLLQNRMPNANR